MNETEHNWNLDDALLFRFGARGYRVVAHESAMPVTSNRPTRFYAGDAVTYVSGTPKWDSRVLVRRGQDIYEVGTSDLIPQPTPEQVAWMSVEVLRQANEIEALKTRLSVAEARVRDEQGTVERQQADLKEYAAEVMRREEERDQARDERDAALRQVTPLRVEAEASRTRLARIRAALD